MTAMWSPTWSMVVPLRLVSETNQREHWRVRAKRRKAQREATQWAWRMQRVLGPMPSPPCTVTITRCAPRMLDDDNAVGSVKGVRDELADILGVNDNDSRGGMGREAAEADQLRGHGGGHDVRRTASERRILACEAKGGHCLHDAPARCCGCPFVVVYLGELYGRSVYANNQPPPAGEP